MHHVRLGEVSLLSELFERHHRRLHHYCWRMAGAAHAAEDVVQEVFLRMLRHRETYDPRQSFQAWMFSIARNIQYDAFRRQRREEPIPAAYERTAEAEGAEASPERSVEIERVRAALESLPAEKRELVVMSRFLGMTHAEIADATGCEEAVSRTRLHRALIGLREQYEARTGARKEEIL